MNRDWIGGTAPNRRGRVRHAVFACAMLANGAAFAQDAAPAQSADGAILPEPTAPAGAAPPAAAPPATPPGFLDALGRWLGDSKAKLDDGLKSTKDAIGGIGTAATGAAKNAASAAQQATGAVIALPGTRIVGGRERCAIAANGAPDCLTAASALCHANGFASGRALDMDSRQKCPAWVWWSNRRPIESECRTESFVVRALCQ
ncbi:MAG TPA: hypothetical protein VH684_30650 [Xanthobacteraceae bacterium]|jgi:hypothetical protein